MASLHDAVMSAALSPRQKLIYDLTHTACIEVGDGLWRVATDAEARVIAKIAGESL